MNSISPNLNIMMKACEKASKVLIRDFGEVENLQVSKKGPSDFVTNTDRRVEKILINELSKYKKNYSIISEESGSIVNNDKNNFWIIDPIDGTTNFLHGVPHFCISVALRSYNEIVCGLIFDPIKNELFYGQKNDGAFLNNHRLKVSKKIDIEECLFASNKDGIITKLNTRITGSAALDLSYVAAGRFDGFFQKNLNLWDVSAALIILQEAGGIYNDINFKQINNHNVKASSEIIHEKMLKILDKF